MSSNSPTEPEEVLVRIPNVIEEDWTGTGFALFVTNQRIIGIRLGCSANIFGSKSQPGAGILLGVGEVAGQRFDPMRKKNEAGKTLDQLLVEKKGSWTAKYGEVDKLRLRKHNLLQTGGSFGSLRSGRSP